MNNNPPTFIYMQDKDDHGDCFYLASYGSEITWCRDRVNDNDSVYVHAPQLENKKPALWAMRQKKDGILDFYSIRRTKKYCMSQFEANFGQYLTPEILAGWECVKVFIQELPAQCR